MPSIESLTEGLEPVLKLQNCSAKAASHQAKIEISLLVLFKKVFVLVASEHFTHLPNVLRSRQPRSWPNLLQVPGSFTKKELWLNLGCDQNHDKML